MDHVFRAYLTFIFLAAFACLGTLQAFCADLDELKHPLLDKNQFFFSPYYNIGYTSYDYEEYYIYGTGRRVESHYDWDYWKNTFGLDMSYGLDKKIEVTFGIRYSLDYNYSFSYKEYDSSIAEADYDWEDTKVKYGLPLSFNTGVKIRPLDFMEIDARYNYARYNTYTRVRYGSNLASVSSDGTASSDSLLSDGTVGIILLSKPKPKYELLRSDLDGRMGPLLGKSQVMLKSDCIYKFDEFGYRYRKNCYDQFLQDRTANISFSNDITVGLTDSLQANANIRNYLPYTYVSKTHYYLTQKFSDGTQKYYSTYSLGGELKKRFGQNTEIFAGGLFNMWKYRCGTNYYSESTGISSSDSYPYTADRRTDKYAFTAGLTYLSDAKKDRGRLTSNLDGIDHPLLESGQFMAGAAVEYDLELTKWELSRPLPQWRSYRSNKLFLKTDFVYGITDRIEFQAGAKFDFPYQYEEDRDQTVNKYLQEVYTYKGLFKFYIDSAIIYRPRQNMDFSVNGGYMPWGEIPYQYQPPLDMISSDEEINDDTMKSNTYKRIFRFSTYYLTVKLRCLF